MPEEEDKENKIKKNNNNVINYLKAPDLWPRDIYKNPEFDKTINDLRLINGKICQIISFYDALGKDIKDDEFDDIKKTIENEKKKNDAETGDVNEESNDGEDDNSNENPSDSESSKRDD